MKFHNDLIGRCLKLQLIKVSCDESYRAFSDALANPALLHAHLRDWASYHEAQFYSKRFSAHPSHCHGGSPLRPCEYLMKDGGRGTSHEEGEQLFRMLSDFGDHELVLSGLHENMLSQRYLDTHMEHTCQLFSHLQAADAFMTATGRTMDFAFMAYLPAAMLGVRAVVAGPDRWESKIQYSHK